MGFWGVMVSDKPSWNMQREEADRQEVLQFCRFEIQYPSIH